MDDTRIEKALAAPDDTEGDLDRKMIAVAVNKYFKLGRDLNQRSGTPSR